MDKVISFGKGIRRQPSIGDAGELSELVNLIPKNGELVNVKPMNVMKEAPKMNVGETLLAVHKVSTQDNYIVKTGDTIVCRNDKPDDIVIFDSIKGFDDIAIVGNTIVVSDNSNLRYAIWKDGMYANIRLNNKSFTVEISGSPIQDGNAAVELSADEYPSFNNGSTNLNTDTFTKEQISSLYRQADTILEEYKNTQKDKERYFKYVTLGFAAMKAYDGTYISYSDIFTLDPITIKHGLRAKLRREDNTIKLRVNKVLGSYIATISSELNETEKQLIAGVDIFLTNPTSFVELSEEKKVTLDSLDVFSFKDEKGIKKEISEMYFYKSLSIEVEDFGESVNLINPTGSELSIADIPSYLYSSSSLFSYNGRLHLSGATVSNISMDAVKRNQLSHGYFPSAIETYGYYGKASDAYSEDNSFEPTKKVEAVIEVDITDPDVGSTTNKIYTQTLQYPLPPVLSYPSMNAKRMRIYIILDSNNGIVYMKEFDMVPMTNGNISICINADTDGLKYTQLHNVTLTVNALGEVTKVEKAISGEWTNIAYNYFISKVKNPASQYDRNVGIRKNIIKYTPYGNPFVFPPINTISVGEGEIGGISTSAKALSQGQFGQFPLYAFCTDGIWALEVASDGSYSAKQPISRDVCNNADSITQVDGAVVFTTDQGLKLIQGSEVVLLSGQMDGHNVDESVYFPEKFFEGYGHAEYDELVTPSVTDDFRTILATSKIAYDYPNRLLRIYPESGSKWYVYSLESQEFSSEEPIEGGVKAVVAGYPTSLIQVRDAIYTFKNEASDGTRDGLLLTRPVDMGEPFALKKLHDMRTLYTKYSDSTFVKVVIYVSNDGVSWAVLPSLRRGSFKYYRLAMITRMTDADRLSGTVMRYTVERNNKLR